MELAEKLHDGSKPPADAPQSLDVKHVSDGPGASTFPNGCHVAEVEIDPETGVVEVVSYACVNDFGTVVNPLIVEGQLHGGVVQGIGQALMEKTVYDDDGQLLTGSFMDYAMPRADDAPPFALADHPVPATTNPLGVKGCGEAGCAGALTSVMNAVVDALSRARHPPYRHAADAGARLAGAAGREGQQPAMTQAVSVQSIRPAESRLIAGVCAAHMVSHYYMLHAGAAVRLHPRRFRRQLYRARSGADRVQRGLRLLQTPVGFLVDRIGARFVLIAGLALSSIAYAVAGAVGSYWVFIAMYGVAGLGNTVFHPADYSLLSHHAPPERLSHVFSFHTFAGMVGSAIAPVTLLYMQSMFGWRGAYIGAAIFGLLVLLVLVAQPEPAAAIKHGREKRRKRTPGRHRYRLAPAAVAADPAQPRLLHFDVDHERRAQHLSRGRARRAARNRARRRQYGADRAARHERRRRARRRRSRWTHQPSRRGRREWTCGRRHCHGAHRLVRFAARRTYSPHGLQWTVRRHDLSVARHAGARRDAADAYGRVFGFVSMGFNIGASIAPIIYGMMMDHGQPLAVFMLSAAVSIICISTVTFGFSRREVH